MRARSPLLRNLPVALLTLAGAAPAWADMRFIETEDLRVTYFDPTGEYLVPYATQCFLNALAAQHTRFGYTPDGKPTVLLQDFSDRGNATAMSAPRNRIYLDIAPPTLAFETFSPGERMFTIANHEVVHLATFDRASPEDQRCRHWLGGKVTPTADHPESLLYNYLTTPRNTAPRWYHEGSAVFMETWLGGGYGRAQGGYDEMMFRAMVRDDARFYDPLGLVSVGTEVDFQVGRKCLPVRHAVHELPGDRVRAREAARLVAARRRIAALLLGRLPARVRPRRSTRPGRTGSLGSTNSSGRTWPRCASIR